jgi:hypothetical protein
VAGALVTAAVDGVKVCTKCRKAKLLRFFTICRRSADGRQSWCVDCTISSRPGYTGKAVSEMMYPEIPKGSEWRVPMKDATIITLTVDRFISRGPGEFLVVGTRGERVDPRRIRAYGVRLDFVQAAE